MTRSKDMNSEKVRNIFLKPLYEAWANGQCHVCLREVAEENSISRNDMEETVEMMVGQEIIGDLLMDWHYELKGKGIILAEEQKLIAEDRYLANKEIRTKVLEVMYKVREEEGIGADVSIDTLRIESGLSFEENLKPYIYLLADIGYLKSTTVRTFQLTESGIKNVQDFRLKTSLRTEYDEISRLAPTVRGRRLQKFLAKVISLQGWSQQEGVRTSNEEMDVIVFQGRDYYLIECKWEKKPMGAPVIRELFGKLANRDGVRGIVASISGFTGTKGAVKQVEEYSGQKIILLFGPEDIKALIHQTASFDDLLNQKYKELVTRRKAIFS
jgi:Restriction endonuclease